MSGAKERRLSDDLFAPVSELSFAPARRAGQIAVELQDIQREQARLQALQLEKVAAFAWDIQAAARLQLSHYDMSDSQKHDMVERTVDSELAVVLGISERWASTLVDLARALTTRLPESLAALGEGRIDLYRARLLADGTLGLSDDLAAAAERELLASVETGPCGGPSPRVWRTRIERVVARLDRAGAAERARDAKAQRAVTWWLEGNGMASLRVTAPEAAVRLAHDVLTALAKPVADEQGLPIDAVRADVALDLLTGPVLTYVSKGETSNDPRAAHVSTPVVVTKAERELGLVMHADTFLADGPAADDPGQVRGYGRPRPVDADTTRDMARQMLEQDGAETMVLLVDGAGILQRLVPAGRPPAGGWTRATLAAAVRAGDQMVSLHTDRYEPAAAITAHVRAAHPGCEHYDCARPPRECDLDHDVPWPRGPTAVSNLRPRCRSFHGRKTRRLVFTELGRAGFTTTRYLSGAIITTGHEPLPGFAPGEAYGTAYAEDRLTGRLTPCGN